MADHATFVRDYLTAIGNGIAGPKLAAFFDPEVVQEEFPNGVLPAGATRDLAAILASIEDTGKRTKSQTFEVKALMAGGERIALEVVWNATLASALGPFKTGAAIGARIAMFLELRQGKIYRQRIYSCFGATAP